MCGRVTLTLDKELIMELLDEMYEVENTPLLPSVPRYNVAPGDQLLSLVQGHKSLRAGLLTWGFVPKWTKENAIKHSLINARSETALEKPTFKASFQTKRCILLADHFYEWKKGTVKRPYLFSITDQPLMPMAGLYTTYTRKDGSRLNTCAILTCAPNNVMAPIHHRMPVILPPDALKQWLNPTADMATLQSLMVPYAAETTTAYQVSTYVNTVANKGPECIQPLTI